MHIFDSFPARVLNLNIVMIYFPLPLEWAADGVRLVTEILSEKNSGAVFKLMHQLIRVTAGRLGIF